MLLLVDLVIFIFLFNDSATTESYTDRHTLALHDALPIYEELFGRQVHGLFDRYRRRKVGQVADALLDLENAVQRAPDDDDLASGVARHLAEREIGRAHV